MTSTDQLDMVRATARGVLADSDTGLVELGELGLLGLLVPEDVGGMGWCPVEANVVGDEIGRAAARGIGEGNEQAGSTASWVAATIGAAAIAVGGRRVDDRLDGSIDGRSPVTAVAGDLTFEGGRASGSLVGVDLPAGAVAVTVIGHDGSVSMFDIEAAGVSQRPDPASIDTTRPICRLDLDAVEVEDLGTDDVLLPAAWTLVSAVSIGSLRAALERLTPYLSERVAFGASIASFQAIQHRIVDLALLEIRGGVAVDAAVTALANRRDDAGRLAAIAHGFVGEHVVPAIDECIQLSGGIGFTWEYPLHHQLRRAVADTATFGSVHRSREYLLEAAGWI